MKAAAIMVQGTASHVGKSMLCTLLCRIFSDQGYAVAPFKAWNMTSRSCVLPDNREIGTTQVLQARAAGVEPEPDMNPFLVRPEDGKVITRLRGKPVTVGDPKSRLEWAKEEIARSWKRISGKYEVVVIEGAGSPAEVNLMDRDLANMRVAEIADSPVLLVADIDCGGAFAALVGTLEILPSAEEARVRGFVLNRFRGEKKRLRPALEYMRQRTGRSVVGVLPFIEHRLPEEDIISQDGGVELDVDQADAEITRVTDMLREHLDVHAICDMMGI